MDPIGNITYINQNAQVGAVHQANSTQKVDMIAQANLADFAKELQKIEETAPIEEFEPLNPDRERPKDNQEQEENSEQEKKEASNTESSEPDAPHTINILV